MSGYKYMGIARKNLIDRLKAFFGIDREFIDNIVSFVKCLVNPDNGYIDLQIFASLMAKKFEIIDQHLVRKMFDKMAKENPGMMLSVEDMCRIICGFYTPILDLKIDYVFWIYDFNDDGVIDMVELMNFIKSCRCVSDTDEMDKEETYVDLCHATSDILSISTVGAMDQDHFRARVKENPLLLCILGRIMPASAVAARFKETIKGKTNMEMIHKFGSIREEYLMERKKPTKYDIYPLTLDLP